MVAQTVRVGLSDADILFAMDRARPYAARFCAAMRYDIDDVLQSFAVALIACGVNYDPSRATVSTYVDRKIRWFVRDYARERKNNPTLNFNGRGANGVAIHSMSIERALQSRVDGDSRLDPAGKTDDPRVAEVWERIAKLLSPMQQVIFRARYIDGHEWAAIAQLVGLKVNACFYQNRRAMQKLRRLVERGG